MTSRETTSQTLEKEMGLSSKRVHRKKGGIKIFRKFLGTGPMNSPNRNRLNKIPIKLQVSLRLIWEFYFASISVLRLPRRALEIGAQAHYL